MKEKYDKDVGLLKAKLGHGPSLVWRSLLPSLDLLNEGMKLRVRDGKNVKIWTDKWRVHTFLTYKVQSSVKNLQEESKVKQLVKVNTSMWKELIEDIFNNDEAKAFVVFF